MALQKVNLVFGGGKTRVRVVPVRVKDGQVTNETIGRQMKPGEKLLGVIGHFQVKLTAAKARKIMSGRIALAEVAKQAAPLDLGLLFDPKSNMVAMAGEVTVGQMRQFIEETGYKPKGHNAGGFNRLIKNGQASAFMVFTIAEDCLAFINWALPRVQAQDSRIETLSLPDLKNSYWKTFKRKLTGGVNNYERLSGDDGCRSFLDGRRNPYPNPAHRFNNNAFRLVGTYKNS
jgi:hypothetical protein